MANDRIVIDLVWNFSVWVFMGLEVNGWGLIEKGFKRISIDLGGN